MLGILRRLRRRAGYTASIKRFNRFIGNYDKRTLALARFYSGSWIHRIFETQRRNAPLKAA